jgi:hypothetical protein
VPHRDPQAQQQHHRFPDGGPSGAGSSPRFRSHVLSGGNIQHQTATAPKLHGMRRLVKAKSAPRDEVQRVRRRRATEEGGTRGEGGEVGLPQAERSRALGDTASSPAPRPVSAAWGCGARAVPGRGRLGGVLGVVQRRWVWLRLPPRAAVEGAGGPLLHWTQVLTGPLTAE